MPTILDTLGVQLCTVSYGKETSFAGRIAAVAIRVVPKALGVSTLRLVWAATGDVFSAFTDATDAGSSAPGAIVLPQTGQDGFLHGTATFKDWFYEAVVTSILDDGQRSNRRYRFQIPAGTTTLDLDLLDEDGEVTAQPAIAPIPAVTQATMNAAIATAVAGLTGPASAALDTLAEIDATIAADEGAAAALAALVAGKAAKAANLSDLADAAAARTNLGLDTAATRPATAFDVAGAAAAITLAGLGGLTQAQIDARVAALADAIGAAAAAQAASLQKTSNLADLGSAATARTNLGLGSAATHPATDFDPAGAAAAVTLAGLGGLSATSAAATYQTLAAAQTAQQRQIALTFAGLGS